MISETVLGSFLTVVFEMLASAGLEELARSMGIHSQLQKLKTSLFQIKDVLDDASKKEITNNSVKRWLNRLQHLAYDIDDLLDDLAYEEKHRELTKASEAQPSNVIMSIVEAVSISSASTLMKDRLVDLTTRIEDLVKEKDIFGLIVTDEKRKHYNDKRKYETSLIADESGVVGRKGNKEALVFKLLENEPGKGSFSIVPIVGMGGVGKTTLARLLYNDQKVNNHFQLKAWVCVSDDFDVFKISNLIFQNVTGENKEFPDLNMLQVALQEKLKGRRFLVVLDDVWTDNCDDWEKLEAPFHSGAPGSKIIMTTRKEQLLKQLGYKHLQHLNSLPPEDALSLFAKHAFGVANFDSHPPLRSKGEGIVKKCDGLPLALKAVGRLLRGNTDEEDWEDVLNSEIWRSQDGEEILPALKLSYHDLPAHLKQLFAYCSIFPKDYLFSKEDLVLLWMAEGFLHQSTSSKLTEVWGVACFENLLSRSFFEHAPNDDSLFVMHDLMNDLATSVAGDFFLRLETNIEMKKEAFEKCRHVSFVCERYMNSKKFKGLERAKSLRTFLDVFVGERDSWTKFYMSNKVLAELLDKLPLLRVLSLKELRISEVPESVGMMKHLRYLNLSQTRITYLPDNICDLYNLQTLIIAGCHQLSELPNSFLKLKNLRHFDTRDTPSLNKMPMGIGELESLQTLSKIIIGEDNGFPITELNKLKNLKGKVSIERLEKVQNPKDAAEGNLSEKRISELELKWGSDASDGCEKEILTVLKPCTNTLEKLGIMSYGGTDFPNWIGDKSLLRLAQVTINGCGRCTSLPPLAQLPLLKELYIEGMDGVTVVGYELLGNGGHVFASLEILRFKSMSGWMEWSTKSGIVAFPLLKKLLIIDCPHLIEISLEALPLLRVLEVDGCNDCVLRSLVHVASSSINLKITKIAGLRDEVWRGVMEHLGAVEELEIKSCNEIRYMWESEAEASKVLVKLRSLNVSFCNNLVRLGEKEDEENSNLHLTSLTTLTLVDCKNMEGCICPNSIEDLTIWYCESITSVSYPTGRGGGGQKLKSLDIRNCKKVVLELGGGGKKKGALLINNTTMPLLEYLSIYGVENLESIIELRRFIHLTHLYIRDCRNMKSFPDQELQNLPLLKYMSFRGCPEMDGSFPRGLWPPNLLSLEIGGLKKPISKWGPQNFPTSLVDLGLFGGPAEERLTSWGADLSHILPKSLIELRIVGFKELESVSMGLQHLTSLQHLLFENCPKLKELPETTSLLSSLLSLWIRGCRNLEERCRGRGSYYWPRISHIPSILIDNEQV